MLREDRTPRNGLGITTWAPLPSEFSPNGPEQPGLMFIGWWPRRPELDVEMGSFANLWPADSSTFKYIYESLDELGGHAYQVIAYVRILKYPSASDWLSIVSSSLSYFVDQEAVVSWVGGYECSVRYWPERPLVGCYAAFTRSHGFLCLGGLDDHLRYINDHPAMAASLQNLATR